MTLEWENAVVNVDHQALEQNLPYGHAVEVPAFHGQCEGVGNSQDPEKEVHSLQLLDAHSSLRKRYSWLTKYKGTTTE
jgi:hypothetical protein